MMIDPLAKGKQALLVLLVSTCFAKAQAIEPSFKASSENGDFTVESAFDGAYFIQSSGNVRIGQTFNSQYSQGIRYASHP